MTKVLTIHLYLETFFPPLNMSLYTPTKHCRPVGDRRISLPRDGGGPFAGCGKISDIAYLMHYNEHQKDVNASFTAHLDQMYRSSREPTLKLCTDVYVPRHPAPILLLFHGWHGTRVHSRKTAELFASRFVVVNVDMRGRGKSEGQPDVNGWELLDAVDAVRFVQSHFAEYVAPDDRLYCFGASGGGGNVYALLGKFPDLFTAGVALCGISDYASWYLGDEVGEFRDEMDVWLGKHPDDDPTMYRSRSGIHLIENVLTPLLVYHGDLDNRVPVYMGRRYAAQATRLDKPVTYVEQEGVGHDIDVASIADRIADFFDEHREKPGLPPKGFLRVGGYVQTRANRIELDSPDDFATVEYELDDDDSITAFTLRPDPINDGADRSPTSARLITWPATDA